MTDRADGAEESGEAGDEPVAPDAERHEPAADAVPSDGDEAMSAVAPRWRVWWAGRDRARLTLGAAMVVALAVAALAGLRLVGMLVDDEASAAGDPASGPVGAMVPGVFAFAEAPASPGAAEVVAGLRAGRDDVAADTSVAALCAAVAIDAPVEVSGRWERDGAEVASTASTQLAAPGFADCIDAGGEDLPNGTYQFVVTDPDGNTSAPGTVVIGAPVVAQTIVNDGDEPWCGLRIAPLSASFFTWYDATASPIMPGTGITVAMADVRQSLEVVGCGGNEVIEQAQFRPAADMARSVG
ncbi:MAG: hypothetical protein ACK5OX_00300 [Desertimonas sp.]